MLPQKLPPPVTVTLAGRGSIVTGSVAALLLPHVLLATTLNVPLVAEALKLIDTLLVVPVIVSPLPEKAHV